MKWLIDLFKRKREQTLADIINQAYARDAIECCELEGRKDILRRYAYHSEVMVKLRHILSFVHWNPHCISLREYDYYLANFDHYDWVGFLLMEDRSKAYPGKRGFLFSENLEDLLQRGKLSMLVDGDEATKSRAIVRQLSVYHILSCQYDAFYFGEAVSRRWPLIEDLDDLQSLSDNLAQENSAIKITSFKTDEEFCLYLLRKNL